MTAGGLRSSWLPQAPTTSSGQSCSASGALSNVATLPRGTRGLCLTNVRCGSEATGGTFNEADPGCSHCKAWQKARATALQEQAQRSQMIDILSLGTSSAPDALAGENDGADGFGLSDSYDDRDFVLHDNGEAGGTAGSGTPSRFLTSAQYY